MMWTVWAGGVCDPARAEQLRGKLAELLAVPEYGTALSDWRGDDVDRRSPEHPIHLPARDAVEAACSA